MNTITIESPLGPIRLFGDGDELTGVHLPDQPVPVANEGTSRVLDDTARQLAEYFAGERRTFDLPIAPRGTGFQQIVWRALTQIAYAETASYGTLARAIGRPAASRAVGAANGKNPIAIIVPCHRIVGADGTLTGYAGGLAAKQWLLAHEQRYALGNFRLSC
jgi:methylated-DNA-[protein]-cysteine S-methyltransferase